MSRPDTLRWLAAFQERFGQVLRTPLDRSTLTLRAELARYPDPCIAELEAGPHGSARERIAVYNRQYWFRLFGVLQHEYPLCARLLGMWTFNGHASRFLERRPPSHYDVQQAADGFAEFLVEHVAQAGVEMPGLPRLPRQALLEASRIDQAFRTVLSVSEQPPFVLNASQAAQLASAQLIPAPSWTCLCETWPLLELRQKLREDPGERAVALPSAHPEPRHWVVFAGPKAHGAVPLPPVRARLLQALCEHPVGVALARVEQTANPAERELLLAQAQGWLADSVQRGFWARAVLPDAHGGTP